ncbi:hypothetical protein PV728_43740 [Streptomyces europaeiscabiei]|uniref:hypothetical protein n=1 Tax=Streptomyces TaxID=1883 RepID=UPI0029B68D0C|nr:MULTISPECIES: hypothetical protein [Streptomyces]MDX3209106.1 hypothetical protein [Streptomyces scabiei]MDX3636987.1 hypothetical protein [Streptomyces europaeiscabiei]MDX3655131.1 hypothetical protein [Streptomyces europaeiscabiei]
MALHSHDRRSLPGATGVLCPDEHETEEAYMATGRETPAPTRNSRKPKKMRIQIGDDLDVTVGIYISSRAIALLCSALAACGGYGGYLIQR